MHPSQREDSVAKRITHTCNVDDRLCMYVYNNIYVCPSENGHAECHFSHHWGNLLGYTPKKVPTVYHRRKIRSVKIWASRRVSKKGLWWKQKLITHSTPTPRSKIALHTSRSVHWSSNLGNCPPTSSNDFGFQRSLKTTDHIFQVSIYPRYGRSL